MKKILCSLLVFLISSTTVFATDFNIVLDWMHENGLTKYTTSASFRGGDVITRGESSKFVASYAQFMKLDKTNTTCTFNDISDYDNTLVPSIIEACTYGLLKGSQGKFMPKNLITQAQGLTVVMRSLYGIQDETGSPWYGKYYALAQKAGIITNENIGTLDSTALTRELFGRWFYAAAHLGGQDSTSTQKKNTVIGTSGYMTYNESKVEQALTAGNDVYLFFHADRCPSCRILDKNLLAETNFPSNVVIFKINYDTATQLVKMYAVTQQHTVIKIGKDKKETKRNTSATNLHDIMGISANAGM